MTRVLGIDSSLTATGLCRVDVNSHDADEYVPDISCATVSAPPASKTDKSKRAMARRVNALILQIEECFTDDDEPDLIAMESLAYAAKGDSAWVLPWIFGRVIELCEKYGVPLIVVGTSARAKYATGNGRADKDTVMLAAAKRWPEAQIANNNEADALIVAAVGCHYLGYPICKTTQYMEDVLSKVTH